MGSRHRLLPSLLALAGMPALADEGRIPIYKQTTITSSGTYLVTRDFSGTQPIVVQATDVVIDLGGHTVGGNAYPVIDIGDGVSNVTIRNGTLENANGGIRMLAPSVYVDLLVEDVRLSNIGSFGVQVQGGAPRVVVRRCRMRSVVAEAIVVATVQGTGRVVVEDCTFNTVRRALQGDVATAVTFRRNVVDGFGAGSATSAVGSFGPGGVIEDNAISGGGSDDAGISLGGTRSRAARNVVTGSGTHGVSVSATYCLVEGNQLEGNGGCGVSFSGATGSAYRQNMLRDNTGGTVCGTATDGGGNIL